MPEIRETFLLRIQPELKEAVRAYLKFWENHELFDDKEDEEEEEESLNSLNDVFSQLIASGLNHDTDWIFERYEEIKKNNHIEGVNAFAEFFLKNPDAKEVKISDVKDCELARATITDLSRGLLDRKHGDLSMSYEELSEDDRNISLPKEVALKYYYERMEMFRNMTEALEVLKPFNEKNGR